MEDLLKKEESSALGKTVSSLLDTTMTKAAEKVFGNIENKASYVLFDNALSSLPVNAAQVESENALKFPKFNDRV